MQTTLLGLAIALILALATALVGPLLIDWSRYRPEFEARATQLTGLKFHITGPIDARVLPTPTLVMQGIEIARPGGLGNVRARALRIEFGLGALMRGEWRIADARLDAPEFAAAIDAAGRIDWSAPRMGFHPQEVSIEHLQIRDGRAVFRDVASGSQFVLQNLEFHGELRSLNGPFRGEGSFVTAGARFPYRISSSRIDEESGTKVRLFVDALDRPLTAEADLLISFDHGAPHFEGQLQFARPVGRAPSGSQSPVIEPWRLASRVKGDSVAAALEQIEFQYGPDERAIKLRGSAQLKFGAEPRANVVLSAAQVDLDHMSAFLETDWRRPVAAAKRLAQAFAESPRLPIPTAVSVSIESLGFGGAVLQRVGAELELGERTGIKTLEFRAPGLTQIRLSGSLDGDASGLRFAGPTQIETNDPPAFLAWLTNRSEAHAAPGGALRLHGDLSVSGEAIAVEHLDFELDRMRVAGRFAYGWGGKDRLARLDASLTTPDVDVDRLSAIAGAVFGDTALASTLTWPREGALSLKVGRALVLGVEAKQADINLRLDAQGIAIDPLLIGDFGGANLAIRGRIDSTTQTPRGAITLDLDARALDGILAVTGKFAPETAQQIRRMAGRIIPVQLRASLAVDPGPANSPVANAKFKADGRAGTFRLAVQGDATSGNNAFKVDRLKLGALGVAKVNLAGRVESDDSAALMELLRLDRFISVDKGVGRLAVAAKGSPDGDLDVDGGLAAGSLSLSTNGKLRFASSAESPRAELDVKVNNAKLRSVRPVTSGRPTELVPVSLTTHVALAGDGVRLTRIAGTVAGSTIGGQLAVGMQQPMAIEGELDLGGVDLPAAVATALGIPARAPGGATEAGIVWPSEPFERMIGPLTGEVRVTAKRVTLTPKLEARDFKGAVHFGDSQIALQATEASLGGGKLTGELIFLREPEVGLIARTQVKLTGASAAELLPGDGAISGLLRFEGTAEGNGMSPVALIGSLEGTGIFTLENARVARLDPKAFEMVVRAVDQGVAIDADRLRERTDAALAGGALPIGRAEGAITIVAGQARLTNSMEGERGVDLSLNARLNLPNSEIDARLLLAGAAAAGGPRNAQPEIILTLKGPVRAPKRVVDVSAFASWLALRAVEQQSKKLDVLESGKTPVPETGSADARQPETPATQGAAQGTAESPPPVAAAGAEAARARPPVRNVQRPKPARPPVDLRPEYPPPYSWFGVH